ncbi:unnamed protein product [Ectocarpus sp. 6 AP-2014]
MCCIVKSPCHVRVVHIFSERLGVSVSWIYMCACVVCAHRAESEMNDDNVCPSENFVDECTRSACRSLKSLSRQLLMLNASYSSRDFRTSGPAISKAFRQVMTSVRCMQDTLTEAGLAMNAEMEGVCVDAAPSSVVVSEKEYAFLNAVFAEYVARLARTSEEFSLFSSDTVDVFGLSASACLQDSGQTSNAS